MRRKISFSNLEDIMSNMSQIPPKELSSYIGGGSGTLYDPYTWDEYCALDSIGDCYYVWGGVTMHSLGEYVCSCIFENTYLGVTEDTYSGSSSSYGNGTPWGKWAYLTPQERAFISDNPIEACHFLQNSEKAFEKMGDGHNDGSDALRHAYWSALNQMSVGSDSGDARRFGQCHECAPNQSQEEKEMDLHNNDVGFEYGRRALQEGWSEDKLADELGRAYARGELKTLK